MYDFDFRAYLALEGDLAFGWEYMMMVAFGAWCSKKYLISICIVCAN